MIRYPVKATTLKTLSQFSYDTYSAISINMLKYNHDTSATIRLLSTLINTSREVIADLPYQVTFNLQGMDFISLDRLNAFYYPTIKGFEIDESEDTNCLYGYSIYTDKLYKMHQIDKQTDFIRHSLPVDSFFSGAVYPGTKQAITLYPYIKEVVDMDIKNSQVTIRPYSRFAEDALDSTSPIKITIYGQDIMGNVVSEDINIVANINTVSTTEWRRISGFLATGLSRSVEILFCPYIAGDEVLSENLIISREQLEPSACILTLNKSRKQLEYNALRENLAEYPVGYDLVKSVPVRVPEDHSILAHYIDEPNSLLYAIHGKPVFVPEVPAIPEHQGPDTVTAGFVNAAGEWAISNPQPAFAWQTLTDAYGNTYFHCGAINSDVHSITLSATGTSWATNGVGTSIKLNTTFDANKPAVWYYNLPSVTLRFSDATELVTNNYVNQSEISLTSVQDKILTEIYINFPIYRIDSYGNQMVDSYGNPISMGTIVVDVNNIQIMKTVTVPGPIIPEVPAVPAYTYYTEHTFSCYPLIIPITPDNALDTDKTEYQAISVEYEEDCINEEWNMWIFPTSKTNDVESMTMVINGSVFIENMLLDLYRQNIETNRITIPFADIYTQDISSALVEIYTTGTQSSYTKFRLDRTILEPLYNKDLDNYLRRFKKPSDVDTSFTSPTMSSTKTLYKGGDLLGWGDGKYGGMTETLPEKPFGFGGQTDINYQDIYEMFKLSSVANVGFNGQKIQNIFNTFYVDDDNKYIITSDTITHIKGDSCMPVNDFHIISQTQATALADTVEVTFDDQPNPTTIENNLTMEGPELWKLQNPIPQGGGNGGGNGGGGGHL